MIIFKKFSQLELDKNKNIKPNIKIKNKIDHLDDNNLLSLLPA
jgi:hypothetical protein